MQQIWYTALSAYKSLSCLIYALAPVSKFNTNKLTKMRAIPQRKQHFPVSTTHKSYTLLPLFNTFEYIIVDSYFQGLNLDIDALFHKGDTGGWSDIKLRVSMARLGLHDMLLPGQLATLPSISGYRQQATLLTVVLTKLLVVSLLWYRHCSVYLNFSKSTLHKPSQRSILEVIGVPLTN